MGLRFPNPAAEASTFRPLRDADRGNSVDFANPKGVPVSSFSTSWGESAPGDQRSETGVRDASNGYMRRFCLNFACLLSLLILLITVTLWVRSHFRNDGITIPTTTGRFELWSYPIGKTAPVPVLSPPGGFKIRDAS